MRNNKKTSCSCLQQSYLLTQNTTCSIVAMHMFTRTHVQPGYALGHAGDVEQVALLDLGNAAAGVAVTLGGGVGGRSVQYNFYCDASVPASAGPTNATGAQTPMKSVRHTYVDTSAHVTLWPRNRFDAMMPRKHHGGRCIKIAPNARAHERTHRKTQAFVPKYRLRACQDKNYEFMA